MEIPVTIEVRDRRRRLPPLASWSFCMRLVSLMAENADFFYRSLAAWITRRCEAPVELFESVPWPDRQRMLDAGQVQIGFICGLPYVQMADRPSPPIELLAAPVMRSPRYRSRPIYYSDVVVRRD